MVATPESIGFIEPPNHCGYCPFEAYKEDPFLGVLEKMATIHAAKNTDYGNSFELAAKMLGRPVVEVLLSRMADKLARACNLVQRNGEAAVKDESLSDTLVDLANYAVLAVVALGKDNQEDKEDVRPV